MINFITTNYSNAYSSINNNKKAPRKPLLTSYSNNLKPLAFDTVSFSGNNRNQRAKSNKSKTTIQTIATQNSESAKTALISTPVALSKTVTQDTRSKKLNLHLMQAFENEEVCQEVSENAKFARNYLKKILNSDLNNMLVKNNPKNGILETIDIRVKTPDSIREKIANVLNNTLFSDTPEAFNPMKAEEIKKHCTDLIGARIVMAQGSKKDSAKVIDALLKDIATGRLKVTEIEHYVAMDNGEKIGYFDEKDLKRLQDAVNGQRTSKGLEPIEVKEKIKASGYTALHLDVDLSSSNFVVKENGYKGEIQILGYDVCKFKDLEDLCYKTTSDKMIKAGDAAYSPFTSYFKEQMENPKYTNLQNDFREYTRRAFLFQKKRTTITDKNAKYNLPTIEDCQMQGKIPPGLDFNILNNIKLNCDRIYAITSQHPVE